MVATFVRLCADARTPRRTHSGLPIYRRAMFGTARGSCCLSIPYGRAAALGFRSWAARPAFVALAAAARRPPCGPGPGMGRSDPKWPLVTTVDGLNGVDLLSVRQRGPNNMCSVLPVSAIAKIAIEMPKDKTQPRTQCDGLTHGLTMTFVSCVEV